MEQINKIKVLIIGDYLIFRNGLKMLIDSRDNLKVIGEVTNLAEATNVIAINKPDVLLIDSKEILNDEFENFLSSHCKGLAILVLTNSKSAKKHEKYLLLGASGVVTKQHSSKVLFKAIEKVNCDDLWFKEKL